MCIRDSGIFAVYLRIVGIGLIDFISHTYTGCGHAGFRIDADDAHNAFIGHDFPYREYAGDTSMDLGYTSGTLVSVSYTHLVVSFLSFA